MGDLDVNCKIAVLAIDVNVTHDADVNKAAVDVKKVDARVAYAKALLWKWSERLCAC